MEEQHHIVGYGRLISVWLGLVCLTALTVLVSRIDLGGWNVVSALAIASAKTGLVCAFFMHMRYESRLLRWLPLVAIVTLAIFIGLTFFDTLYR